jgi:hypothetical protein
LAILFFSFSAVLHASPKEARVAVIVGSNIGVGNERPLQFAEQDAERFYQVLTDIGGIEKDRAYLVKGGDATEVRRAVNEAKGRMIELSKLGPTALIVYVSSHADEKNLHLEGTLLPIAELRKTVQNTPSALRLVIIDACRTAASAEAKGGSVGPNVAVKMEQSEKLSGDLFIHSTGMGEPAQEWSFLRGALFTHHLVTGLRGAADMDGNGRISLSESYSYAFRQTLANAVTAGPGAQHPSFDFQMKGFGDWTFTTPTDEHSAIVLGKQIQGRVWVVDNQNNIVAEVMKNKGAPLRLAVRPGWYRVIIPKDQRVAEALDVTLAWGKERVVTETELVTISLRDAAARGQRPVVLRPVLVSLRYLFSKGDVEGVPYYHSGALAVEGIIRHWIVGVQAALGWARFQTLSGSVMQMEFPMQLRFGRELTVHLFSIHLGLAGGAIRIHQEIFQNNEASLIANDIEPPSSRKAWFPETGFFASFLIPINERLLISVDGAAGLKWVADSGETLVKFSGRVGGGIAMRF